MAEDPTLNAPPDGVEDPQDPTHLKESVEEGQEPGIKEKMKELLEAHGVSSPDDFSSLIQEHQRFKQGYGDSRNEVGELRRQIDSLRSELSQRGTPQPQEFDYDDSNQGIDLMKSMRSMVREELMGGYQSILNAQNKAAQHYQQQRQALSQRPNWDKLQPEFDRAMQDPDIFGLIQTGNLTMGELFSRMNERYLVKEVESLYNQLPEGVELKAKGQASLGTGANIPSGSGAEEERREKIEKAKQRNDVDAVIGALFDDNDPIFQ